MATSMIVGITVQAISTGGVVRELGRHRISAAVETEDDDGKQAEHDCADRGDNIEQDVVEPNDVPGNLGDRRLEFIGTGHRATDDLQILLDVRAIPGPGRDHRRQGRREKTFCKSCDPLRPNWPALRSARAFVNPSCFGRLQIILDRQPQVIAAPRGRAIQDRIFAMEFAPFENLLDRDRANTILKDASVGSDDCELFLERQSSETLAYDDQRLRTASYNERKGFGLRAVAGEVSGYAHSNSIDEPSLKRAAETVQFAVRNGTGRQAPAPPPTEHDLYPDSKDEVDATFPVRIELLKEIDAYLRSGDNRVVQASASLSSTKQEVVILRPDGSLVCDTRPMARLNISVILEEDGRRESGSNGAGGRFALDRLMSPEAWKPVADEAMRIARVGLLAEPAPRGCHGCRAGPGLAGNSPA